MTASGGEVGALGPDTKRANLIIYSLSLSFFLSSHLSYVPATMLSGRDTAVNKLPGGNQIINKIMGDNNSKGITRVI